MAANIFITNSSLDISIDNVDFNGVQATYAGGAPLPNQTGDGTTNLETNELGTHDLVVYYGATIGGQSIIVTDSNGYQSCQPNGAPPGGSLTFTNITYDGATEIQIDALDGNCGVIVTPTPTQTPTPDPLPTPTASVTPLPTNWTQLPTATPTFTPTQTQTPSVTPISTYTYLGKTNPDSADSATACSTYVTIRGYVSLKSSLSSINVVDVIYDS